MREIPPSYDSNPHRLIYECLRLKGRVEEREAEGEIVMEIEASRDY